MALGQTLRYYRGQFNPEAAYGSSGQQSGIISMYNPESQAQFIEAVAKRQERFDTAKMAEAQEIARLGETETYDLPELNNRIKAFESSINDLVKNKYNGDYGAAANEIAKMIGTERTNPFYHFNKQKVEMSKAYLDTKMKLGANFLSSGNPLNVTFQDWQQGKTFDFTPINSSDITERSASVFQTLAKTMQNDPKLRSVAGGQYFEYITQNGFKDENEALDFIQNNPVGQQMVQQIYDSMPELQGVDNQEAVLDAITQGAFAGIGNTESRLVADQSYLDALQQSRIKSGELGNNYFNLMTPTGAMSTKKYFEGEDSKGNKLGAVRSYTINSLSPNRMSTSQINELETIKKNLGNHIKLLAFGDKPDELVNFINKKSRKNVERMDIKESVEITDIGFSPDTSELVLGISGYDKEGTKLEAGLVLDAGTDATYPNNNKVLNLIPYLETLGEQSSDFNKELYTWMLRNYPSAYQQYQTNQ